MNKWWIRNIISVSLLLLTGCGSIFPSRVDYGTVDNPWTTQRSANVPRTTEGSVDIETLLFDVKAVVHEILPDAYLRGVVFAGYAYDLDTLDGRIIFDFVQINRKILGEQIVTAGVTVETETQILRVRTRDETGYYPSTDQLYLAEGLPLREIALIALAQLEEIGFEEHEITLTRLQDNEWVVVCGEIGTLEQECRFEIDAMTGETSDVSQ